MSATAPFSPAWRPSLHPAPSPPTIYDRIELFVWVAVLALSFTTAPTDWRGEPNAPLKGWLETSAEAGSPPPTICVYKRTTGFDCGGCGLTRGFVQLAHGNPGVALALNPLTPLIFLWVLGRAGEVSVLNLAHRRLRYGIPNVWRWRFYGLIGLGLLGLWLTRLVAGFMGEPSPL